MKKGILAALALSLALPACALGEAGYTAGTYSAEAQGMESAVKVTVTVSDSAIISASSAASITANPTSVSAVFPRFCICHPPKPCSVFDYIIL